MDLTKAVLPESVEVAGRHYPVRTGHPWWFRFYEVYSQERAYVRDFDFLYVGDIPQDRSAGFSALVGFFYEPREVPRLEGSDERVLDYSLDADLIYAAVLQCYGVDLFAGEWHWHKVRAMIAGVHGTRLNDVMGYRACDPKKNADLRRMKRIWELPVKVTAEEAARLKAFSDKFYGA